MKSILVALALSVALPTAPAFAAGPGHCPPGLAKKNPPCIPPGQAKKWRVGDRYDGRYRPVRDWWRYDLPRPRDRENWIRLDNVALRINEDTMRIIELIVLSDLVFNN